MRVWSAARRRASAIAAGEASVAYTRRGTVSWEHPPLGPALHGREAGAELLEAFRELHLVERFVGQRVPRSASPRRCPPGGHARSPDRAQSSPQRPSILLPWTWSASRSVACSSLSSSASNAASASVGRVRYIDRARRSMRCDRSTRTAVGRLHRQPLPAHVRELRRELRCELPLLLDERGARDLIARGRRLALLVERRNRGGLGHALRVARRAPRSPRPAGARPGRPGRSRK
jgi:hypothetical protein